MSKANGQTSENRKKVGRPLADVDAAQVEKLAGMGCTQEEIASVCGCSVDTLERRFADAIKRGRNVGKRSLRRMQWKSAKGGNVTMQIWLGKQILGQSDKQDVTSGGESLVKVLRGVSMDEL